VVTHRDLIIQRQPSSVMRFMTGYDALTHHIVHYGCVSAAASVVVVVVVVVVVLVQTYCFGMQPFCF